jgi:hypothetical protein
MNVKKLTHSEDLPRPHDPVVQRVDNVEDVGLPESHFALFRFLVVEMGPKDTMVERALNFIQYFTHFKSLHHKIAN